MNFARLGIIALIHVAVLGALYVMSGFGNGAGEGASLAGANGLATWSNQDPAALKPTVGSGAGTPFDAKASDLSGYNARSGSLMAQADSGARPQRFDPIRPSEARPAAPASSAPLQPIGRDLPNTVPDAPLPSSIEYTIKSGDNLWDISRQFGTTVPEIQRLNPGLNINNLQIGKALKVPRSGSSSTAPLAPATTPVDTPAPAEFDGSLYSVKSGDTLSEIASRQGVTVNQLMAANGLTSTSIQIGQKLKIPARAATDSAAAKPAAPAGRTVSVRPGDSLYKIAAQHDVSVVDLVALNKIKNEDSLRIGQVLLLPSKRGEASPALSQAESPASAPPEPPPLSAAQPVVPPAQPQSAPPETLMIDEAELPDTILDEAEIERPVIPIEE